MKKALSLLLCMSLAFGMTACSSKKTDDQNPNDENNGAVSAESNFNAGTYSATVPGRNGDLTVEVEVTDEKIVRVEVTNHVETPGLCDGAVTDIPQAIIDSQSIAVDTISGATVTSEAVIAAATEALLAAGAKKEYIEENKADKKEAQAVEYTADVVVAGGGCAGLTTAIEAANAGAKVILIEKLAMLGGSTARSGGKIQAAGTELQKENGIEDSVEQYIAYLDEVYNGKADKEFTDFYATHSAETYNWLVEQGVEFKDHIVQVHPSITPFRIHETAEGTGAGITNVLADKARELGVEIIMNTPATELIIKDGTIVGLKATNSNEDDITINADSVILATGGYDQNKELMAEMAPSFVGGATNVSEGNTGDAIYMVKEAGANIIKNDLTVGLVFDLSATQFLPYNTFEEVGLLVNTDGERFMNEFEFMFKRTRRVLNSNGVPELYYILDQSKYNEMFEYAIEAGKMFKADTIEELAEMIGMNPETLRATVDRYNELSNKGVDEDFGKQSEYMNALSSEGPYYASHFTLITSGSFGGPQISMQGEVINTDGNVIPGLYAAGECASGQMFGYEYPGSGTAIQAFVTFGRVTGTTAAKYALSK